MATGATCEGCPTREKERNAAPHNPGAKEKVRRAALEYKRGDFEQFS